VTLLLEAGADVQSKDSGGRREESYGFTPLHLAAHGGHAQVVALLLDAGADAETHGGYDPPAWGATPLHLAAKEGHAEVVTLLIETGADVESWARFGDTPAAFAVQNEHTELARTMEAFGAKRKALLSSPGLVLTVWRAITATTTTTTTPPSSSSSFDDDSDSDSDTAPPSSSSSPAPSRDPPPPFRRCPWPRFAALLPRPAASELLVRVVEARADLMACIALLCVRAVRRLTRASGLWPVRNALRDFLVYPEPATRRMMRELEPVLQKRAAME